MYIDILILSHLIARPHHGYEIKKDIQRTLGAGFAVNNNLLYPALRRFEESGVVRREIEAQQGKPDRHLYHLTDQGMESLRGMLRDYSPVLAARQEEFFVRVALFDLIDPDARREILAARRAVLQGQLAQFTDLQAAAETSGQYRYALPVVRFLTQEVRRQLDWIDELAVDSEGATNERPPESAGEKPAI